MSCLICAGSAETVACTAGWEERRCAHCGPYRMSQNLVITMMDQGQIFDTGNMRLWLDSQRTRIPVPAIDIQHALLAD